MLEARVITTPMAWGDCLMLLGIGALPLLVLEGYKLTIRRS